MRRAAVLCLLVLGCGVPALSDAGAADAGPVDCTGTFGPGTLVLGSPMTVLSPAVTADELSLVFESEDANVWEATRSGTSEMFSAPHAIASLTDTCLSGPHPISGVDVSMDGLRVYVSCRTNGALFGFHRDSRDAPLVLDGMIATHTMAPAITAGELELYDLDVFDIVTGQILVHASRANIADPFPTATPLAGLEGRPNVSSPDVSPDGLTLYGSTPRVSNDGDRHLVAFTRTSTSAAFDASTETPLAVEGTRNAGQPEIAASCRAIYYAAGDPTGIHLYVARR